MAFYAEDDPTDTTPLMNVIEAGDGQPAPPLYANVEFLNLEEGKMFDKVQSRIGGVARQVLKDAVILMKATFSPAQLSGIAGWVTRDQEAARLMGDKNEHVVLMKNEHEVMNLADNFTHPEQGPVPIPEYINGQQYLTLSFFVDLGKVYDGPTQPVFKLAKTDVRARNKFKLLIQLYFVDGRGPSQVFESPVFRCRTRRAQPPGKSVSSAASTPEQPPSVPPTPTPEPFSPPIESPASTIQSLITDNLVARTAKIDDLVYGSSFSYNADIAYYLRIKDDDIGAELEEGDVVGFFTNDEDGGTYIKRLRSNDIEDAVHAGVVSRSFYLAANKSPEDEGKTDTVCVIGIVNVKVIGSVENGERVYASLDRPGKAIPQSHLPVGSFLRKKHVLLGTSMERRSPKSFEEEHLVKCFVCIVLDTGRQDILDEVENMYELSEKSTKEQINFASKKAWRKLRCCFSVSFILFVLLVVLLYQVFVPGSSFRYWLCRRGSVGGDLRVSVITYSSVTTRIGIHGIRFTYSGLKGKVSDSFTENKQTADYDATNYQKVAYYFLNLDRCAYFGDKGPVRDLISGTYKDIGGGKILSIDYNCRRVYWFDLLPDGNSTIEQWYPYKSARNLTCDPNPPYL